MPTFAIGGENRLSKTRAGFFDDLSFQFVDVENYDDGTNAALDLLTPILFPAEQVSCKIERNLENQQTEILPLFSFAIY